MGVAILLCAAITLRRAFRNRYIRDRQKRKVDYQIFLRDIIRAGPNSYPILKHEPACHIDDKAAVFLHYFRTLKGEKFEALQDLISGSDVEAEIIKTSYEGTRGTRMQAVKMLSYLNSQTSLEKIYGHLSSQDKYIRRRLNNSTGIAACLEALVLIMPPKVDLDFTTLMTHANPAVRSAAVALSSVTAHSNAIDLLKLGLSDEEVSLKIRAAKIACDLKRTDLTSEFYALTASPIMWLRYWAMRAIWASGPSGEKFLASLSKTHPMAEKVTLEMRSGYV